jgi:type IV secretory system conjugative DNA transfer VirD4/TraG family protein
MVSCGSLRLFARLHLERKTGETASFAFVHSGKHLAYGYLALGFGGLVLCAKGDECPQWKKWAADTGRSDDLIIIDACGKWRMNFIDLEANRQDAGGGFTINIVALLDEVSRAISGTGKASGEQKFWDDALHTLLANLVDLPVLADLHVSLPLLREIASSAPTSLEQLNDPKWHETSRCAQVLRDANENTLKADPAIRADFEECQTFWTQTFPALGDKTRSSIMLGFDILIRPLVTRPLRSLFSTDTNVRPEDTFDGKIIIVDLPVQNFKLAGRIANLLWKLCFQQAVLRRTTPAQKDTYLRPCFLYADESQNYVSKGDAEYVAVARSSRGATIFLVQNRESFRRVLGDNDAVDSLLANLQAKFFCANTGDTNEWASRILGQHWMQVIGTTASQSREESTQDLAKGGHNSGVNRNEQLRNFVEPSRFTTLKRGGALYNFQVEALVYNGGNLFTHDKGSVLPWRLLTFNQS